MTATALALKVLDIVIPVYNEEAALVGVGRDSARAHGDPRLSLPDHDCRQRQHGRHRRAGSAGSLQRHDEVRVVTLARKGRGHALKQAWSRSDADVLVYMDVDLSTDLNALLPLVAPLLSGHSDLAIGSRLARSSRTVRGPKREAISRTYNVLLRGALRARFSDAQCGFKAIRRDVAAELLPLIEDDEWFFDTELLVVAERAGLRIHEIPVDWVDDTDSSVDIVRTAAADLRGMGRLGWALVRGRVPLADVAQTLGRATERSAGGRLSAQIVMFALIGIASTIGYGVLFLALRGHVGPQMANALALAMTAVANTAANRRFTFGFRGPEGAMRHQAQGLLVFGTGLAATSGALMALDQAGGRRPPHDRGQRPDGDQPRGHRHALRADAYVDLPTRTEMTRTSPNELFRPMTCTKITGVITQARALVVLVLLALAMFGLGGRRPGRSAARRRAARSPTTPASSAPSDEAKVQKALDDYQTKTGFQLFVVYVKSFDGLSGPDWSDQTATKSGLGTTETLLAVAVDDRKYGTSVPNEHPISDSDFAKIETDEIEPALGNDDWAGAAIAAAEGYTDAAEGSGLPWGAIVVGGVVVAGGGALVVRRMRRKYDDTHVVLDEHGQPIDPLSQLSTDELNKQSSAALVGIDDAIKTSEQELGFAEAQFGKDATREFAEAVKAGHATRQGGLRSAPEARRLRARDRAAEAPDEQRDHPAVHARSASRSTSRSRSSTSSATCRPRPRRCSRTWSSERARSSSACPVLARSLTQLAATYPATSLASVDKNADQAESLITAAKRAGRPRHRSPQDRRPSHRRHARTRRRGRRRPGIHAARRRRGRPTPISRPRRPRSPSDSPRSSSTSTTPPASPPTTPASPPRHQPRRPPSPTPSRPTTTRSPPPPGSRPPRPPSTTCWRPYAPPPPRPRRPALRCRSHSVASPHGSRPSATSSRPVGAPSAPRPVRDSPRPHATSTAPSRR